MTNGVSKDASAGDEKQKHDELQDLIAQSDTGARTPPGVAGKIISDHRRHMVAVPALDRIAIAVHGGVRGIQRYRDAIDSSGVCHIPRLSGLSATQEFTA